MTQDEWRENILRRLQELEKEYVQINTRLFGVEEKNAVDEVHRINVEKRLLAIEESLKWLVRLIIGAIVLSAMAFVMNGGITL